MIDDVTKECLAALVDTSISGHRVARELTAAGFDVEVRSTFPDALADLAPDQLLVVNAGLGPVDDDDATWRPLHQAVRDHAAADGPAPHRPPAHRPVAVARCRRVRRRRVRRRGTGRGRAR